MTLISRLADLSYLPALHQLALQPLGSVEVLAGHLHHMEIIMKLGKVGDFTSDGTL